MKVIDAVWEKTNLGASTVEIVIENCDNIAEIDQVLRENGTNEYVVVKSPSDYPEAISLIQNHGFSFVEASMSLIIKTSELTVDTKFESVISRCSYREMGNNDILFMEEQVRRGIFSTDRISVDPMFSRAVAANRYINWMRDLNRRGNPYIKVDYDNKTVGFFINNKLSDTAYDGVLAGVYEPYLNSGMGYCVQWAGVDFARSQGAKKYFGHISINNPGVLKILVSLGYNLLNIQYIFVKHGGL